VNTFHKIPFTTWRWSRTDRLIRSGARTGAINAPDSSVRPARVSPTSRDNTSRSVQMSGRGRVTDTSARSSRRQWSGLAVAGARSAWWLDCWAIGGGTDGTVHLPGRHGRVCFGWCRGEASTRSVPTEAWFCVPARSPSGVKDGLADLGRGQRPIRRLLPGRGLLVGSRPCSGPIGRGRPSGFAREMVFR
jgi:hypothetical protein